MNADQILKMAEIFCKRAQSTVSAQAGDIQTALQKNKLWDLSSNASPLLDAAGVPDTAKVAISLLVNPGPAVNYNVSLQPQNPAVAKKLSGLLKQKFGPLHTQAIASNKLNVENPTTVNWLNF